MNRESIARFPSQSRIHIALAVADVDASRAFYETLFGQPPVKVRQGYAKFEPLEPSVNLSINHATAARPQDGISHFGIQLKSSDAVAAARQRVVASGLAPRDEENVTCCYAVQDKFWVADPDGNQWEFFVVIADADVHSANRSADAAADKAAAACCAPGCCSTAG